MPKVICSNPDCNNEYYVKPSHLEKGYGRTCSKECRKVMKEKEKSERWNTICKREGCGKKYYIIPSKKKKGLGIYCSHECYSLDKVGKKLSEDHKKKIGENTKRMWEDGVFDAPEIREAYAKQGRSTKGSKRTKKQKEAMSKARKGKPQPQLHTPEAIAKAVESRKGLTQSSESNKKRSETLKGRVFSKEHREKLSKAHESRGPETYFGKGEDNPNYRNGASEQAYPNEFRKMKRRVRRRDNNTCRICHKVQKGRAGVVHHIDANKDNNEDSNLIFVCRRCHGKIHYGRTADPVILAFRSMLNY